MSIHIRVGDRFVVTSDQYQFILQEKKTAKSGKNTGKEWLDTVGFYPSISKLVSGLALHYIFTGDARQFSDLEKQIEQLGQKCQEAFAANDH
ncbi:DUF5405 family protein [Lelliottia amnigena]